MAIALIAGALIAFGGFLVGYGVGFAAAHRPSVQPSEPTPDYNRHQTFALTAPDAARDFLAQLDRIKRERGGTNQTRAKALEWM